MADKKIDVDCIEHVDQVLVDEAGRIQRLPVPSDDPNDPLNFALWEKTGIVVCCCWFCKFPFPQLTIKFQAHSLSYHVTLGHWWAGLCSGCFLSDVRRRRSQHQPGCLALDFPLTICWNW